MKRRENRLAKLEASGIFLRRPRYFMGTFRLYENRKPDIRPAEKIVNPVPTEEGTASEAGLAIPGDS